jgi:hypothetical protein
MQRVPAHDGSGELLFGQPPFGWRLSRDRRWLVKDPDERRVIAVVRHMFFVQRMTMRAIVRELEKMGVRNRRGTPYVLSRVHAILHDRGDIPPEARTGRTQAE